MSHPNHKERKAFDAAVTSIMKGANLLSEKLFDQIKQLPNYNIRRLVHWIRAKEARVVRECIDFFAKHGVIGTGKAKLSIKWNFA